MEKHFENDAKPFKIEGYIPEIQEIASILWNRGWAERNAGNISILCDKRFLPQFVKFSDFIPLEYHAPELEYMLILISISGSRMRELAVNPKENLCLIEIGPGGESYRVIQSFIFNSISRPTSELSSHLAIYRRKLIEGKTCKAIVHAHAREVIILSNHPGIRNSDDLNKILWGIHPEAIVFLPDGAAYVPYLTPGSVEIAAETFHLIENRNIAVWEKHGCLAVGDSPMEAFELIDITAKACDIYISCLFAGFEPQLLNPGEQEKLRNLST